MMHANILLIFYDEYSGMNELRFVQYFCCHFQVYNLGTGQGYSVIEMAKAFEKASGKPVSILSIFGFRVVFRKNSIGIYCEIINFRETFNLTIFMNGRTVGLLSLKNNDLAANTNVVWVLRAKLFVFIYT